MIFLRPQQVAKYLGVSLKMLKANLENWGIPYAKTEGGHRRYKFEDLEVIRGKLVAAKVIEDLYVSED